ncbi:MAG: hypothetical protein A2Y24_04225 [Clostridiales bacterium GWE2_32_10]|nr:MAG: hypothetical protein A2Y24_04225 [Clostridiales bacterium GWE2_32_10]
MRAVFIHGLEGDGNENWFPWLRQKLKDKGIDVITPRFPTPEDQSLENWFKVWEGYKDIVDEDTIFVGHSLGPAFVLNVLEESDVKVKSAYLVAPFVKLLGNEYVDGLNKTFVDKSFDWSKIKENCNDFNIYYSNNDPYVPEEASIEVAEKENGKAQKIEGAGHFNKAAGYMEFEKLYEDVMKGGRVV